MEAGEYHQRGLGSMGVFGVKLSREFICRSGLLIIACGVIWPSFAGDKSYYAFKGPHGETLLTDNPRTRPGFVLTHKGVLYNFDKGHLLPPAANYKAVPHTFYDTLIKREGDRHGVDAALIKAVMHVESGFNAGALSSKGAQGLMQLMPKTAEQYHVNNPYSPSENIAAGAEHLAYLMQVYGGNIRYVLAAYNAGEGNVERYGGVPPFPETRSYVEKVIERRKQYNQQAVW